MKKVFKLLLIILNLPLYWISFFIPRDKNLWIFGAWFGQKYADNSKYFFEYVNKFCKKIRAIWLAKDKETIDFIQKEGYEAFHMFSIKGYLLSLRAKIAVLTVGIDDINPYTTGNMKFLQLWHGTPLKRIVFDDEKIFWHPKGFQKFFVKLSPLKRKFINYSDDIFISTSKDVRNIISSAFRVKANNVKITGYPRTDIFFNSCSDKMQVLNFMKQLSQKGNRIVIYMPTHREVNNFCYLSPFIKKIKYFDEKLRRNKIFMFIKMHFYQMERVGFFNLNNIIFLTDSMIKHDIYNFLPYTDLLITDYSSVYFDYLLLDKPIVFAPFDIESYKIRDREFYYNYDDVTPGPKVENWDNLIEVVEKELRFPERYKKERERVCRKFHKYNDGKSCERVFKEVANEIFIKKTEIINKI